MKKRTSFSDDGRGKTCAFINWEVEKAKRLLKRGQRYLPLDLETTLMEQGIDVTSLKSKYQA